MQNFGVRLGLRHSLSALQQPRFLSTSTKALSVTGSTDLAKVEDVDSATTKGSPLAKMVIGYSEGSNAVLPEDASVGKLSQMPAEQLTRTVVITKQLTKPTQSGKAKFDAWRLKTVSEPVWTNNVMGWRSFSDPVTSTGFGSMSFASRKEAVDYCKTMGLTYAVEDAEDSKNLLGKVSYTTNFLNEHVQRRIDTLTPKRVSKMQFAHPERGTSCWVNLEHTDYGEVESKQVSQTHWQDVTSPQTTSWKDKDAEEYARKLGK